MSQHNNIKLEDRLRDELKDASFLPPPAAWDRIEAALPGGHPWYVRHRWPVSAAVLLIAFFSTYFFHQTFISQNDILAEGSTTNESIAEVAEMSAQKSELGRPLNYEGLNIETSEKSPEASVSKAKASDQNPAGRFAQQNAGKKSGSTSKLSSSAPTNSPDTRSKKSTAAKTSKALRESKPSVAAADAFESSNPLLSNEGKNATTDGEAVFEAAAIGYQPPMLALDKIDYVDDESKYAVKAPASAKSKKQKKEFQSRQRLLHGPHLWHELQPDEQGSNG
jgi:hypothetical protein